MMADRLDPPIVAAHARLVSSAYNLFKLLDHSVIRTAHQGQHETLLSVRSAQGESWLAKCDSNSTVATASIRDLIPLARSGQASRVALITSGQLSQEDKLLAASNNVEVIDGPTLSRLLAQAEETFYLAHPKAALPDTTPTISQGPPTAESPMPPAPPLPTIRRCPYCAEEIQVQARICKHCGRDLSVAQQLPAEKRMELQQQLVQFETALVSWEGYLREQEQLAQNAGGSTSRVVWILVGILLVPVGIGIVIVVLALVDIFARGAKRSSAQANHARAHREIATLRKQLIEIRAQLASS